MKLKGNYDITESGKYIVIFEGESGEEWEVKFEIRIYKEYDYGETGWFLINVMVMAECMSPGFLFSEEVAMEIAVEEYATNSFNL